MHISTRNVNTAFRYLVDFIDTATYTLDKKYNGVSVVKTCSRNGNVLMIDEPVTITYTNPTERVLFNSARDCNPMFHLYEALWMLAGRNDVASVAYYAKQMKEYSDNGTTLNGAYGYRWRTAEVTNLDGPIHQRKLAWHKQHGGIDQLDLLVNHLKANPTSRRAVLQMWNVEDDLLKVGCTCGADRTGPSAEAHDSTCLIKSYSKDIACNLSVMFSIREGEIVENEAKSHPHTGTKKYLDMTVTNRSNDAIWGLLGTNYVHFSFLQEYMAARLGVEIGKYHHFTNNLHVYEWNWKPNEWLKESAWTIEQPYSEFIYEWGVRVPLVKDPEQFEKELPIIVDHFNGEVKTNPEIDELTEPFFKSVARPALRAFQLHKLGETEQAIRTCSLIKADDWRMVCEQWLQRRKK